MKKPEKPLGFSLFELMVVLMIIALLSATGVVLLSRSLATRRLETGAWQLATQIEHARHLAQRSSLSHRVAFDVKDPLRPTYRIEYLPLADPEAFEPTPVFRPVVGFFGQPQPLGRGVRLVSIIPERDIPMVTFGPSGRGATPTRLVLQNTKGDVMTVAVPTRTGGTLVLTGEADPFNPASHPEFDTTDLTSVLPPLGVGPGGLPPQ